MSKEVIHILQCIGVIYAYILIVCSCTGTSETAFRLKSIHMIPVQTVSQHDALQAYETFVIKDADLNLLEYHFSNEV